jgi:phosphoglycerol transferase MdoB-like AlkP superfamily enzyme
VIPEKYKGAFPKGNAPIHESIAYADNALRKFFQKVEKKPWFKDTLFVLTADHTSKFGTGPNATALGRFRIPIAFFDPGNPELRGLRDEPFQQIDILPSVIDYINLNETFISFGKSFRSEKTLS